MTYRLARQGLVDLIEDVHSHTDLYKPQVYGDKYKHDESLDPRTDAAPPGKGRLFCLFMGDGETEADTYTDGLERTRCDVRVSVWLPYKAGKPADTDVMVGTIYEELRRPLLQQSRWNQPTSTIVLVQGPQPLNILTSHDLVFNEDGACIGVWVHLDLSLVHTEVPS